MLLEKKLSDLTANGNNWTIIMALLPLYVFSNALTTVVYAFGLFELTWGILQLLFYYEIVHTDVIADAFSGYFSEDHGKYPSYFLLLGGGVSVFTHMILAHLAMPSKTISRRVSRKMQKIYLSFVFLHILLFLILLSLCFACRQVIISNEKSTMISILIMPKNHTDKALKRMDMYQAFRCCGSNGILDWMKVENISVPLSCCKRPTQGCQKEINKLSDGCRKSSATECRFYTSEVNRNGCNDAISLFVYSNAALMVIHIALILCILTAWILNFKRQQTQVKPPSPKITMVREFKQVAPRENVPKSSEKRKNQELEKEIKLESSSPHCQGDFFTPTLVTSNHKRDGELMGHGKITAGNKSKLAQLPALHTKIPIAPPIKEIPW